MTDSARSPKGSIPFESYEKHITGVQKKAVCYAYDMEEYAPKGKGTLSTILSNAALFHDLGKLCPENQAVLRVENNRSSLPMNHVDAGTAYLLSQGNMGEALLVYSHHTGLPDLTYETLRYDENLFLRDEAIHDSVDRTLDGMLERHMEQIHGIPLQNTLLPPFTNSGVAYRMMLSCLVDADHTDSATHEGKYPENLSLSHLRAEERLKQLIEWAERKKTTPNISDRNYMRSAMFDACCQANIPDSIGIVSCDSPVGTGKTTAVMAHLLQQAVKRKLRRVFVVLPFTNIISQSVKTYRDILTLPGENPCEVVAELHHKADFDNEDIRYLSALWQAPIIVTTAVAFFETLAASKTGSLRKLHELPGSAIFVDEAHAALPIHLWKVTWQWLNALASEWNCYWVLASGSLCHFWEIEEVVGKESISKVPAIIGDSLRSSLSAFEEGRVTYRYQREPMDEDTLVDWVMSFSGSKILIMNTVQSAAVIADRIAKDARFGRGCVEHLSSSLIPADREKTLRRIEERLKDPDDNNWILVATSCVEAGMDFSFHTGFREIGSLSALLQAAGRVNREGKWNDAIMWSFSISNAGLLKINNGYDHSSKILKKYLEKNYPLSPTLMTRSLIDELAAFDLDMEKSNPYKYEVAQNYPQVEKAYKVIDSDTMTAVIDSSMADAILNGETDWRNLQNHSVQIHRYHLDGNTIKLKEGLYQWVSGYDDFLGYMKGLLFPQTMNLLMY